MLDTKIACTPNACIPNACTHYTLRVQGVVIRPQTKTNQDAAEESSFNVNRMLLTYCKKSAIGNKVLKNVTFHPK